MVDDTSVIIVKKGNYGMTFTFTIRETDGSPKNLTGITPHFRIKNIVDGTVVDHACTIVEPATNGICQYTSVTGDFDTVGTFNADVQLQIGTAPITYKECTRTFVLRVQDDF